MKIQRFLIWIQDTLLNKPDISIKTFRLFIDSFEINLSEKESSNKTVQTLFRVIKEIGLKQISLIEMNNRIITNNLENKLNDLKKQ